MVAPSWICICVYSDGMKSSSVAENARDVRYKLEILLGTTAMMSKPFFRRLATYMQIHRRDGGTGILRLIVAFPRVLRTFLISQVSRQQRDFGTAVSCHNLGSSRWGRRVATWCCTRKCANKFASDFRGTLMQFRRIATRRLLSSSDASIRVAGLHRAINEACRTPKRKLLLLMLLAERIDGN